MYCVDNNYSTIRFDFGCYFRACTLALCPSRTTLTRMQGKNVPRQNVDLDIGTITRAFSHGPLLCFVTEASNVLAGTALISRKQRKLGNE